MHTILVVLVVDKFLPKIITLGENVIIVDTNEYADVAQSVERHLGKVEVVGSIPIISSKGTKTLSFWQKGVYTISDLEIHDNQ